jgi:hypothetical protein
MIYIGLCILRWAVAAFHAFVLRWGSLSTELELGKATGQVGTASHYGQSLIDNS